ncbi:peptide ABC transporter permease [Virgibacillus profundi]|uniref:Peptide ABC transporter permease n=1 Tax=Virgibacillus profundi TaxID=2024555 RepID=A0A2A2I6M8_9BACI|nr:peptide ABC transporter permease [Virgibacillus profundi]PXY51991.1 ABC transporter permease [Virgibacillus profundi]
MNRFDKIYGNISSHTLLRFSIILLGLPVHIVTWVIYQIKYKDTKYRLLLHKRIETIKQSSTYNELIQRYEKQHVSKKQFFNEAINEKEMKAEVIKLADVQVIKIAKAELENENYRETNYQSFFQQCLQNCTFIRISFIPGLLMYLFLFIYPRPMMRFIFERLWMTAFVIISVTIFVFTILYFSPSDPAANILGEAATKEQRIEFNHQYGLDQPYLVQLWDAVKGIITFDLGYSYTGNEDVMSSISNKFPITLIIAFWSLLMSIAIAIPVGMISAAKRNSFWDYSFMFIALIGLSIPNFWQGLIFILNFSIKWHILPATYSPSDWLSIIMPVIVLGTGLTASVARMTRSSILEVVNEDYIVTAKAKGLLPQRVFVNHALRNAMIPIITIIGLQFGGMLGGAAVTEKVFNISGLGSYIVDKQFVPDIPAVLGGVVYIAIVISLVNLIIDILYTLLDPRTRSQMKNT